MAFILQRKGYLGRTLVLDRELCPPGSAPPQPLKSPGHRLAGTLFYTPLPGFWVLRSESLIPVSG